jgi:hypothetical protein
MVLPSMTDGLGCASPVESGRQTGNPPANLSAPLSPGVSLRSRGALQRVPRATTRQPPARRLPSRMTRENGGPLADQSVLTTDRNEGYQQAVWPTPRNTRRVCLPSRSTTRHGFRAMTIANLFTVWLGPANSPC